MPNSLIFTTENFGFHHTFQSVHRGSYTSAHVLLNLLNELGEKPRCKALPSILSISPKFNKFNNTGAWMQDSILISYDTSIVFNLRFSHQTVKISPLENATFLWKSTPNFTKLIKVICIFNPLAGLSFLMHNVITAGASYNKYKSWTLLSFLKLYERKNVWAFWYFVSYLFD